MKLFAVNNNLPLIKYLPLTELFTIYKFGKSSNPHTSQSQSYKNNEFFFCSKNHSKIAALVSICTLIPLI